jgi:glycosyltransferase involved in cell wall biosynthesis
LRDCQVDSTVPCGGLRCPHRRSTRTRNRIPKWSAFGRHRPEISDVYLGIEAVEKDLGITINGQDVWWIGHDVLSGRVAQECAARSGSRCAVIHHMNYSAYSAFKHAGRVNYQEREVEQRALFSQSDALLAVGPLLTDSASKLTGRTDVRQLIPGLARGIAPIEQPPPPFRAIAFGRMGGEDDPIKQGRLAIAGFAKAVGDARSAGAPELFLSLRPEIRVYGTTADRETAFRDLYSLAERQARRNAISVTPYNYTTNRSELWSEVAKCHVAIMPSWQEGFGLVGWEAIAAEVPLLISRQSGLYRFITQTGAIHKDEPRLR